MTGPTVSDCLDAYHADRSRWVADPGELPYVIKPLRRHMGSMAAAAIDQPDVDAYVAARVADGVLPQTARRELNVLMAAWRLAHKQWAIPPVPSQTLPAAGRARQRYLTPEEAQRLMAPITEPRPLSASGGASYGAGSTEVSCMSGATARPPSQVVFRCFSVTYANVQLQIRTCGQICMFGLRASGVFPAPLPRKPPQNAHKSAS
ncbi:MAG: hypothetical protein LBE86_10545 [Gemmobacter sp.]|jgi:hypothetical protein|nr:hypothetical protein [Gemmobacter sp.]